MRKKKKINRKITPDPVYNDEKIAKFICHLMNSGKKNTARRVLYDCFENIKKQTKKDPQQIFEQALDKISPRVEVISRRIGGAHYQIPKEVSGDRQLTLAMKWLIKAASSSKGKPMAEKLADELIAAVKNEGNAIKKKKEIEKIAEANRAFAHFAW
jgi:small subunit ribosomal protein S7